LLLGFLGEKDPVVTMLQWIAQEMMQIEAEAKVGSKKGKHSKDRTTYSWGQDSADGHAGGDRLSLCAEPAEGWLHSLLRDRDETVRAGTGQLEPGSLHQRRLDPEDRAVGSDSGVENISACQVSQINK
jgi:hypothetical protein